MDTKEKSNGFIVKLRLMEKTMPFARIIACVAAVFLTVAVIACSGGGKELVGTWEGDYGIIWSFTRNEFTQETMGIKTTVPYKIKGNYISAKYQGAQVEMEFAIDGDTLTVNISGFKMAFERVK